MLATSIAVTHDFSKRGQLSHINVAKEASGVSKYAKRPEDINLGNACASKKTETTAADNESAEPTIKQMA